MPVPEQKSAIYVCFKLVFSKKNLDNKKLSIPNLKKLLLIITII